MNDIWVKDSSYITQYEYVGDAMPFTLLSVELSMPRQGVTNRGWLCSLVYNQIATGREETGFQEEEGRL